MTQNPNTQQPVPQEQEPFIPPFYMLIFAAVGLIVALVVRLTQPTFGAVGWGALVFTALALAGWVLIAPDQARELLRGRALRFGGVSLFVTILFIAALVLSYNVVRGLTWRLDFTQGGEYSLNDSSRQVIRALAADPSVPSVRIIAFLGLTDGSARDRYQVLFDDFNTTSSGKISYEYVDPERNPQTVALYQNVVGSGTVVGQVLVVPLDAAGQPVVDKALLWTPETGASFAPGVAPQQTDFQTSLTNTILKAVASGDFRVYVLAVQDGREVDDFGNAGLSDLRDEVSTVYTWQVETIDLFDLTSPTPAITLNDPAVSGDVLVIPGGSQQMTDEEIAALKAYLDAGGSVVIYADAAVLDPDATPLAMADNMTAFLRDNYGISFVGDYVLDAQQAVQIELNPIADTFDATHPITQPFAGNRPLALFPVTTRIEVQPTLPANVTVTQLIKSSDASYARPRADILALAQSNDPSYLTQQPTDPTGPFVVMAAAQNSATGARLVLVSSADFSVNLIQNVNVDNFAVSVKVLEWALNYAASGPSIPPAVSQPSPADSLVFIDQGTLRNMNFLVVVLMPFGTLAIGAWVWWTQRERGDRR